MANTITKRELVSLIQAKKMTDLSQTDILNVVQAAVGIITESLENGDSVVIRNFGSFEVRHVKAKVGRNPKNPGKDVPIPARTVVKFKPGKKLKEVVADTKA